ncbi:dnaJ homolog subfamily C member 2-like isoform X3 [Gordionus sp. m RMFG-2023]|uniref:dnaJ homolog subfamily C member 2-like isoform X3 n=1 Tax=Gordionus sp. m RMFG-2023 TaxID=3053472 RepID=UPI0031FD630F
MEIFPYEQYRDILEKIPFSLMLHNIYSEKYVKNFINEELLYLLSLDPKNWKNQDHYKILGLEDMRYNSTEEDIKKAYKKKALNHHPDKRYKHNIKHDSNDYFPCIIKAFEILSDPIKRRSYDSVDPLFNNDIPETFMPIHNDISCQYDHFLNVFDPVFNRNSRWSTIQPVPTLKYINASSEEVNNFYSFWYDFQSWREFSYLDKEDKTKGENRDERKWIEKQNKIDRQKLKKDEINRIRKLVDIAYKNDPRIERIKLEAKERKNAYKLAKQMAMKTRFSEEDESDIAHNSKEEEEKKQKIDIQNDRKRALKCQKKLLTNYILAKSNSQMDTNTINLYQNLGFHDNVEFLIQIDNLTNWLSLDDLIDINRKFKLFKDNDTYFEPLVQILKEKLKDMTHEFIKEKTQHLAVNNAHTSHINCAHHIWTEHEIKDLIKATELYPSGTISRWEVIAHYLSKRYIDRPKTSKDIIDKFKELKSLEKSNNVFDDYSSKSNNTLKEQNQNIKIDSIPIKWTCDEQKLLEKGIKTISFKDHDRWQKIAEIVKSKTKLECMMRYKELAEIVKKRKNPI